MSWTAYILLGFCGAGLFFAAAAWALHWAHRNGQLRDFDDGATVIFDDEEPAGLHSDRFPKRGGRSSRALRGRHKNI